MMTSIWSVLWSRWWSWAEWKDVRSQKRQNGKSHHNGCTNQTNIIQHYTTRGSWELGRVKRRAVPKKERHGSLFLYKPTKQPDQGHMAQTWIENDYYVAFEQMKLLEERVGESPALTLPSLAMQVRHCASCTCSSTLCEARTSSSGLFVLRQISMCVAFVQLPSVYSNNYKQFMDTSCTL